jgi:hypothetical protein
MGVPPPPPPPLLLLLEEDATGFLRKAIPPGENMELLANGEKPSENTSCSDGGLLLLLPGCPPPWLFARCRLLLPSRSICIMLSW